MNCDTACDFNMRQLYDFHMAHGKLATIMVRRRAPSNPADARTVGTPGALRQPL